MLLKLIGLLSLICLLVLLPQVRSSRLRFPTPHRRHTHTHGLRHSAASSSQSSSPLTSASQLPKPHIQMVTGFNAKLSQNANFDIAMVTVPRIHQVADQLGANMLDTPVSGQNPGGNSGQSLLGDMLDTPVSGPNPSGNSESLRVSGPILGGSSDTIASMLDTPVSGPSPSGNSNTLGNMLDTPVSGPNPSGNSQGLFVAGPHPRGSNHAKGLDNKLDNSKVDNKARLSAVSGPNPGGNSAALGSNLSKGFAQVGTSVGSSMGKKAEPDTLFGELPRTPVPPSGPSPIHNSVATNQGLLAGRKSEWRLHRV